MFLIAELYLKYSSISMTQNVSKSILEVYFIFTLHKYVWRTAQVQQDKIPVQAFLNYGALA